jgi:hypothetical protein
MVILPVAEGVQYGGVSAQGLGGVRGSPQSPVRPQAGCARIIEVLEQSPYKTFSY